METKIGLIGFITFIYFSNFSVILKYTERKPRDGH